MIWAGGPWATIAPSFVGDHLVGVAAGLVEVVENGDEGVAVFVIELCEQIEQVELEGQVQERGGFVKQHQRCFLCEDHRHPDPLPLTAGEFVDLAAREVFGVRCPQR